MTDFAALLVPDRGQPATRHPPRRQGPFRSLAQGTASERVRAAVEAQRFQAKGYELAILPGDGADAWSVALGVAKVGFALALVPRQGRRQPARRQLPLLPAASSPARPRWAGSSPSTASIAIAARVDPQPRPVLLSADLCRHRRPCPHGRSHRPSPRSRRHSRPPTWGPAELASAVEAVAHSPFGAAVTITQGRCARRRAIR
jgi:leucyl aminopeptidase